MLQIGRWQTFMVIAAVMLAALLALPNVLSSKQVASLPSFLPTDRVVLGLDLRGGTHLLLQADTDLVKSDYQEKLAEETARLLRQAGARANRTAGDDNEVVYQLADTQQVVGVRQTLNEVYGRASNTPQPTFEVTDSGLVTVRASDTLISDLIRQAVSQSIEVLQRRVNLLGLAEASIARQGDARIVVQVPGLGDPQRLKEIIGRTARLTFHLVAAQQPTRPNQRVPAGLLAAESEAGGIMWLQRRALLTGSNLVDAKAEFNQRNQPVVVFRLDSAGAVRFGRITTRNVGKPFATVLDDRVITAPVIEEPITQGVGQISGRFTLTEANDLALLLRAGALPTKLVVVEERVVGPGLGSDSIAAGETAVVVALVAVLAFMLLVYRRLGAIACVALLANITMIVGMLSLLQAALTLPGIAGIVLTIGMAVDANVLIFERIREEAESGKPPIAAADAGFATAREPIIDANLTTLIAAVILFLLGSGPVRGFAVTLSLGTITSVFTALMVTRLLVALWLLRGNAARKGVRGFI